jgi:hypothetical protein
VLELPIIECADKSDFSFVWGIIAAATTLDSLFIAGNANNNIF